MSSMAGVSRLALVAATFYLTIAPTVYSYTSYANDFVDPTLILSNSFSPTTIDAQQTIISWADELLAQGPWSVVYKNYTPPTGNKHDYASLAPYWWPDCSKVGNTTALTDEQIWTTCPYISRDGEFNPDVRVLVNDIGSFGTLSDAVFYSGLAWALTGNSTYAAAANNWIRIWFVDPDTIMNPNLDYAQMQRGPGGQVGTHTGVLDLKSMVKILSGVLILRNGKAAEWTSEVDDGFVSWAKAYIPWLQTNKLAIEERDSTNNHGSFYFNQLAALQILVGDNDGAKQTLDNFFTGIYQGQISANGDQPLESARTRPYHYRAYNLAAMLTNARLGQYVGYNNTWNITTKQGATIRSALDYAMNHFAAEAASELYPVVGAVASTYGDPNGTYAKFLLTNAGNQYPSDASFLWNQPLSDSGLVNTSQSIKQVNAALVVAIPALNWRGWMIWYLSCTVVMAFSVLDFF
ncbi:hypothetical protein QCA50_017339 [Cerrena zonata]|uniref:Alginate lyase domain-containing protein n=1 Tax=Cerrena zonata TaxID=2478898 RepID=A0AAW0FH99_9APHY